MRNPDDEKPPMEHTSILADTWLRKNRWGPCVNARAMNWSPKATFNIGQIFAGHIVSHLFSLKSGGRVCPPFQALPAIHRCNRCTGYFLAC